MKTLETSLKSLESLGQSVWLDTIDRQLIRSGQLKKLTERDGLSGVTSNPAIFEKAINETDAYNDDIARLIKEGKSAQEIYEILTVQDIQEAADVLRPVYDRTKGRDGFVSLEVNPHLARDSQGTIEEVRRLWKKVDRPNIFIKIPGTVEGLAAIKQCLSESVNINITLLFGLPLYRQVAETYIEALEAVDRQGKKLERVASVASFFLSRIDVMVDPVLEKRMKEGPDAELAQALHGQVAISSAKVAYRMYKEIFSAKSFGRLAKKGACTQRLLWASTSTKNPQYPDTKYVEPLIGAETINTMPPATLEAYRDHGSPASRLGDGVEEANHVLARLSDLGICLDDVTDRLIEEGIEKFNKPYDSLLAALEKKGARAAAQRV